MSRRNRRRFSSILLLLCCSLGTGFSQSYTTIYHEHLPADVCSSAVLKNMAELQLRTCAEIHPNILYYYLTELRHWYITKDTLQARQYDLAVKYWKSHYRAQRSTWASAQIRQLSADGVDQNLIDFWKEDFNDYLNADTSPNSVAPPAVSLDSSMQAEIVLRYYDVRGIPRSDRAVDPVRGRMAIENAIAAKYRALSMEFQQEGNTEKFASSIIDEYKSYWFVFPETALGAETELTHFISRYLNYRYSNADTYAPFSVSFGMARNHASVFTYTIPVVPDPYTYDELARCDINQPQYAISGTYAYQLKPVNTALSQVLFSMTYLWMSGADRRVSVDLTTHAREPFAQFDQSELTIKSLQSLFVSATTPILYLRRNIVFELGAMAGVNRLDYTYTYRYSEPMHSKPYVVSGVQKQLIVLPVLKLTVDLTPSIYAAANYPMWYHSLTLGYRF